VLGADPEARIREKGRNGVLAFDPHHSLWASSRGVEEAGELPLEVGGGFLAARKPNRQSAPGEEPTVEA